MTNLKSLAICFLLLCTPISIVAMDFTWRRADLQSDFYTLVMDGEIHRGDYDKFRQSVLANLDKYKNFRQVSLSSNGGDLVEALRIAKVLRSIYANVTVPKGSVCASACFFLYLSAVDRFAVGQLGVHRPYFDPAYFTGLKIAEAEKAQYDLEQTVKVIMQENSVPQQLIEEMNRTSSAEIHWLSSDEIKAIGERPSWYEELLIARCKLDPKIAKMSDEDLQTEEGQKLYYLHMVTIDLCEDDILEQELKNLPTLLSASNTSSTNQPSKLPRKRSFKKK